MTAVTRTKTENDLHVEVAELLPCSNDRLCRHTDPMMGGVPRDKLHSYKCIARLRPAIVAYVTRKLDEQRNEHAITWDTTCSGCAAVRDKSYEAYCDDRHQQLVADLHDSQVESAQLREENARLRDCECHHGWRGSVPVNGRCIVDLCPSCGGKHLFIGKDGYLTCGNLTSCKTPDVGHAIELLRADLAAE